MQYSDTVYCLDICEARSSLIKKVEYDEVRWLLAVSLRYQAVPIVYEKVSFSDFENLMNAESIGKYYLRFIKPNFKQLKDYQMSDEKRLPTKNMASDKTRFIKISINVQDIKKEWLFAGEKGTYASITLHMKPNGEIDKYGNLGMITQDVPKSIYEAEKNLPKSQQTKGPILGNAAEIDWEALGGSGAPRPGEQHEGNVSSEVLDDLPF